MKRWMWCVASSLIAWPICAGAAPAQSREIARLHASDGATTLGQLGQSIAVSGDTAVVGNSESLVGGVSTGAAYVFVHDGVAWTQQARLVASDGAAWDQFGRSVAISGDLIVVGASGDDHAGGVDAGSAYVFARSGAVWTEQARLVAGDVAAGDGFGFSVAASGDTVVVGAWLADHAGGVDAGAAYAFVWNGASWAEQAKLVGSGPMGSSRMGWSVAVDGDTACAGAPFYIPGGGRALVFVRSGTAWSEQAWLTAAAPSWGRSFGNAIAIDGDMLVVGDGLIGAPGLPAGLAHVFTRSGGVWSTAETLVPSDGAPGDAFGYAVSVRAGRVLVGAPRNGQMGVEAGAAFLFWRTGSRWAQAKLLGSDTQQFNGFGRAVAVSDEFLFATSPGQGGVAPVYVFRNEIPTGPSDVAVLDCDGDGDRDFATTDRGLDTVTLYRNLGFGTMDLSRTSDLTANDVAPAALAAGDLDDDGDRDDLAVACAESNTVALITDVGTATEAITSLAAAGTQPADIAVLDLDADGRDDVVVALQGAPFSQGGLTVSLNGGAFASVAIAGGYPLQLVRLATGDLDGDGDQDVAALALGGVDQILLFTGAGDGSLTLVGGIALPTGGLARGLCADDLDGDGDLDLAVALPALFPTPSTNVRVYQYAANGALDPGDYTPSADVPTAGTLGTEVACGDADGDGLRDLLVVHAGSGDVMLLRGWSGTSFASTATPAVGDAPIAAAFADLDGDGADEAIVANQASNDVTVLTFFQGAVARAYGFGCPGTGGTVPALAGIGLPVQPSTSFGVRLTGARPFAPSLLLFAAEPDSFAVSGGCTVLVLLPAASVLRLTTGAGTDNYVFGIPASPPLLGLNLFFQAAVFDPAGAFVNTLALSDGLRVRVGS